MKKLLVLAILALSFFVRAQAQVDNYCLQLTQAGKVDCGAMPELD